MTKTETIKFRLKKGYTRVHVAVQELDHDVILEAGKVFETDHAGVAHALDRNPALERAPKKEGDA